MRHHGGTWGYAVLFGHTIERILKYFRNGILLYITAMLLPKLLQRSCLREQCLRMQ